MRATGFFLVAMVCGCNSSPSGPPTNPDRMQSPEYGRHKATEERELRDKLVAIDGHISVVKSVVEFSEYRDVLRTVESTKDVVAAEPFVYAEVLVSSATSAMVPTSLKGVDPQRVGNVLGLERMMVTGRVGELSASEPPAILIGQKLARTLRVKTGDSLTVQLPADVVAGHGPAPKHTFNVAGVFYVGFDEYDERLAFASLPAVQSVLGRGDQVMGIELTVKAIDQAPAVARALEAALGGKPYVALDWHARNRQLFSAQFGP